MGIPAGQRRVRLPLLAVCAALLAFAAAAFASPPDAHCTCRNGDGSKLEVGETACVKMGDSSYMARCEKSTDVAFWRKLQDGCPEARLSTEHMSLMQ